MPGMGFVKRHATTKCNIAMSEEKFEKLKKSNLCEIVSMVIVHSIPPRLVINFDQTGRLTGIRIVPGEDWTIAPEGSKCVEFSELGDKGQITATFACTSSCAFLKMQFQNEGKTNHSHTKFILPD